MQAVPHAPQLLTFVFVSTQAPAQTIWPTGHLQAPLKQVWLFMQVAPHVPQLVESLFRSTQAPPQALSPPAQLAEQTPLLHTGVVPEQTVPQAPQFLGSLVVSTQTPLQFWVSTGQTQLPPLHFWLALQAASHDPQCDGSVGVYTHAPPQLVSGVVHPAAHLPRLHT